MRIVHVANFYGPRSGGLRTTVDRLAEGYAAAGHAVALIVPGPTGVPAPAKLRAGTVTRVVIAAPRIPFSGGYRVIDPWRVRATLERLRPDHLEVSDRLTLRGLGRWARARGVPSVMIAHERVDRLLNQVTRHARMSPTLPDPPVGSPPVLSQDPPR